MKKNLYTIQVIPEDSGNTRVFRISKTSVTLVVSFLFLCLFILLVLVFQTSKITAKIQGSEYLLQRNAELETLQKSYDSLLADLDTIFILENKIRNISGTFLNQKKIDSKKNISPVEPDLVPRSKLDNFIHSMKNRMDSPEEQKISVPNIQPVIGIVSRKFLSATNGGPGHPGLDIATIMGDPVYATAPGIVKFNGPKDELGTSIILSHSNNYETWYSHLSRTLVKAGTPVKRGQAIGFVGMTGNTTGPHLHYEVRKSGTALNPEKFFTH